jgi:hypothetical protein
MAPSIAETVSNTADQIHEKLTKVSVEDVNDNNGAHKEEPAPAVQEPKLETQHKEPLKLSGALDHFESFDVTPTIGREFVGVNLAKWLRAPNSDELIRDLAITSMSLDSREPLLLTIPSLPTRCCFLPKARRRYQRSAKRAGATSGRAFGQTLDLQASHPPRLQLRPRTRRERRRD